MVYKTLNYLLKISPHWLFNKVIRLPFLVILLQQKCPQVYFILMLYLCVISYVFIYVFQLFIFNKNRLGWIGNPGWLSPLEDSGDISHKAIHKQWSLGNLWAWFLNVFLQCLPWGRASYETMPFFSCFSLSAPVLLYSWSGSFVCHSDHSMISSLSMHDIRDRYHMKHGALPGFFVQYRYNT